jgi:hypothetical protein
VTSTLGIEPVSTQSPHAEGNMSRKLRPLAALAMLALIVNAPHLVARVRAGARFANGHLVERPDESGDEAQAA